VYEPEGVAIMEMAADRGGSMGKRLRVLGAAIALVVLAVGVVSPALGSSTGREDDRSRTIRVVSLFPEQQFLDLGAEGFSLGDEFVFSSKELKGGQEIAHSGVAWTLTSVERQESHCVGTTWFRGGQVTVQGLVGDEAGFVVPITGGSGKYVGAEGEAHVRTVSETKFIITYRLAD
jgi:hypothetical protein